MSNYLSKAFLTQSFNIPPPTLTEKNLPDQNGRVHIITGGYAGVGQELATILFAKGAAVYIAGRSKDKAEKSIASIRSQHASSPGRLEFLQLDLSDLSSIKAAVDEFTSRESRLDVLVNNAGVMFPPAGSRTAQGHDLQMGTNCLGPYLFTKLLHPVLIATAATAPANSVRVLWAASSGIQVLAPRGGIAGCVAESNGASPPQAGPVMLESQQANYGQSKVGNVLLARETQNSLREHNIVSVSFNPGNLRTELQRHSKGIMLKLADSMLHPAIFGAYTELYSGWSPEVGPDSLYIMPWGRHGAKYVRKDILAEMDKGLAKRFWDWCDEETSKYA